MFKTLAISFDPEQNVIERMLHNLRGSKQQRASHPRKHLIPGQLVQEDFDDSWHPFFTRRSVAWPPVHDS
jgi:hypothetical protein